MYVTDRDGLEELVGICSTAPLVALDTEFMRERTYWARLCLVQVATDEVTAIVDPIACQDLEPLRSLLMDPAIVKVLHAGSQDLEIFYRLFGEATAPVFDTQVAATLAGFPQQTGYGALVKDVLGVTLDKGDTYTDWAKRPLSNTQVEYALNDVRYLPELYRRLDAELVKEGRLGWLEADFAALADARTYECIPEEQWRRVKRVSSLNRRQLAAAREVAAWREREAQRRDVPRRWVLGDEAVVEVARRAPGTAEALASIRGVGDKLPRSAFAGLLAAVGRAMALSDDELPSIERKRRPVGDVDGAADLMIALVRLRARQQGVAMPLLASRDELERLAAGEREGNPLLEGWRGQIVGRELLDLLDGKIALKVQRGRLEIVPEDS